ncbi:ribonuclease E/G [Asticcacaulis tiandongensis]|uniref:ribonuclease E/G n=1 Tax=Asticcacaulis tiandongensis TaxID=2565365 RepID=UPI00112C5324|nr:ribonuclease E/G [Asticcacaulis tiandongensis]
MKLWYEQRFGFGRGAVFRNGQPHLYLEGLINDPSLTLMGVRSVARLTARSGGIGFVQLADGQQAMIDAKADVTEGSFLEVEIVAEPRGDKLARARVLGPADGPVRRLSAPLDIVTRLKARAKALIASDDPEVMTGEDATDHLDTAETQALATVISLGNGADISLEATRALVALDVDLGNAADGLSGNLKSAIRKTNEQAIHETARLLRLSNLAGFVVVDLIGSRHDFDRLKILAIEAFGPEASVISLGGPNRFGTLQLSRPWGAAPHRALTSTPVRQARRLLWRAAAEARGDGGAMFALNAPHRVLEVVAQALKDSQDPLSPRLHLKADETAINGDILRLN